MRKILFKIVLIFFWGLCSTQLYANLFYNVDVFSTENGLADNYVEAIIQDYEGFVWIGTHNGLQRFDGLELRTYKNIIGDSTSLTKNFVYTLYEDSQKRLWIGTNYGGLLLYDRANDAFKRYFLKEEGKMVSNRNVVRSIIEDLDGNIWIGTLSGIGKLDPRSGKFRWYTETESPDNYAKGEIFIGLTKDADGNIYASDVRNGHLNVFDYKTGIFTHYSFPEKNMKTRSLLFDDEGRLWLGDEENGIYWFKDGSLIKHITDTDFGTSAVQSSQMLTFYKSSDKTIWIGRVNGDIMHYNQKTERFEPYPEAFKSQLSAKTISAVYEDMNGNIWLGTHGGGVNLINKVKNFLSYYNTEKKNALQLSHNIVTSFLEIDSSTFWIGTDGGGINVWNKTENTSIVIDESKGLKSNYILDMTLQYPYVWVATWGGGIAKLSAKNGAIIQQYTKGNGPNDLNINNIKGILADEDKLMVASHGGGLNSIDYNTNIVTKPKDINDKLYLPEWGNKIIKDNKSRYWIATDRGAFIFSDDKVILHQNEFGTNNTISSNRVNDILFTNKGQLYFATEQGLDQYLEEQDYFSNLNVLKPAIPTGVKAIVEDKKGRIWMSSQRNLTCWIPDADKAVSFGVEDGILPWQFTDRAAYVDYAGEVYFGSLSGFVKFNPDSLLSVKATPTPHLTNFYIFNNKHILKNKDVIDIDHNDKRITFQFSAINFVKPQKTKFKYFLEGFDNDWNNGAMSNYATYTNIGAGEYKFYVKASSDNINWSAPVSIDLYVSPPWWATWWFRTIALILVVLIGLIIYWTRINNIRQINALLEHKVKVRTQELLEANKSLMDSKEEIESQRDQIENKNNELELFNSEIIRQTGEILIQREKIIDQNSLLERNNKDLDELNRTKDKFFSIIAHDLKNPLNVLIGLSDLIIARFEEMEKAKMLNMIVCMNESSKNLYDLLLNLLEWSRSQSKSIKFSPRYIDLKEIFNSNISLLKDSASKKEITIDTSIKSHKSVWGDQNMVNTVVRNLVSNAIKFTDKDGVITLSAKEAGEGMVKVSVSDTGVGMTEMQIDNLFRIDKNNSTNGTANEKGTGLGLIISKEFVEVNGGVISVESEKGTGTVFSFTLPLHEPS